MTVLIRLFPINMQIRDNINTLFSDKLITLGKIKSLISKNQLVFIVNNSKFNIVMTECYYPQSLSRAVSHGKQFFT